MQCVRKKNWLGAKADYDNARTVAVYMKIPEENMVELFGDLENGIDGLFPYDLVQETFFQTVVKNSLEWRNRSFRIKEHHDHKSTADGDCKGCHHQQGK